MWPVIATGFIILGVLAARGVRPAYIAFVALGVAFLPARVGFQFTPAPCELEFSLALALHSLRNYPHIVLFGLFTMITSAQFSVETRWRYLVALLAVISMGVVIEAEQGFTGRGHCRLRDLVPDLAGFLVVTLGSLVWTQIRGRNRGAAIGRAG